jgi:hypothetical protein
MSATRRNRDGSLFDACVRVASVLALTTGAIAPLCALSSCNIAGPAFYFIHGPEKADAVFTLPPEKTAVVFIDDRNSRLPSRAIRQEIAKGAEETILDGKVLKADLISSETILPIATSERFEKPKTIAEVGTAVGAKTVIYATVDGFALSQDGAEMNPMAKLRVKVVDSESQKRLWPPAGQDWYMLDVTVPTKSSVVPRTVGERTIAEQEFAALVGKRLGQLFVKHEVRDANPKIGRP